MTKTSLDYRLSVHYAMVSGTRRTMLPIIRFTHGIQEQYLKC